MALFVSHAERVSLSPSNEIPLAGKEADQEAKETYASFMSRQNEEAFGCQLTEPIESIGARMSAKTVEGEDALNARLKENLANVSPYEERLTKLEARLNDMPSKADLTTFTETLMDMRNRLTSDAENISSRITEADAHGDVKAVLEKLSARVGDYEKLSDEIEQLKNIKLGAQASDVTSNDSVLINAKLDFMRDQIQQMNAMPIAGKATESGDSPELIGEKLNFIRDRLRALEEAQLAPIAGKATESGDSPELIGEKLNFIRDRLRALEEAQLAPIGAREIGDIKDLNGKVEYLRRKMNDMQNEITLAIGPSRSE